MQQCFIDKSFELIVKVTYCQCKYTFECMVNKYLYTFISCCIAALVCSEFSRTSRKF